MGSVPSKTKHDSDSDSDIDSCGGDEESGHGRVRKQGGLYSKVFNADELLSMTARQTINDSSEFHNEIVKHLDDEINYVNSLMVDAAMYHKKTSYEYGYADWSSWLKKTVSSDTLPTLHKEKDTGREYFEKVPLTKEGTTSAALGIADKGNLGRQYAILCVIAGRLRTEGYNAKVTISTNPSADSNYYIYINWTKPKGRPFNEEFFRMHWLPRHCIIFSMGMAMVGASVFVIFLIIMALTFVSHQYVHVAHGGEQYNLF